MTTRADISLVVTIHREWAYLPRSLLSFSEAAKEAAEAGLSVECVLVFDASDPRTRALADRHRPEHFSAVTLLETDHRSPARARQAGIAASTGNYLFLLDADDLISFSILPLMWRAAHEAGPKTILTPKLMVGFDALFFTVEYFRSESISLGDMVLQHLYNARLFAARALFQDVPYRNASHEDGFAFEDWLFNCDAIAAGYRFEPVAGTAWYYRIRPGSVSQDAEARTTRQIPPSPLFTPSLFLRRIPERPPLPLPAGRTHLLEDAGQLSLLARINRIDPLLAPENFAPSSGRYTNATPGRAGRAWRDLCQLAGDTPFRTVIFLPEKEPLSPLRLRALCGREQSSPVALLADQGRSQADRLALLASETHGTAITAFDIGLLAPELSAEQRRVLLLRFLQHCAADAVLHVFAETWHEEFLAAFGPILSRNQVFRHSSERTMSDPTRHSAPSFPTQPACGRPDPAGEAPARARPPLSPLERRVLVYSRRLEEIAPTLRFAGFCRARLTQSLGRARSALRRLRRLLRHHSL